MTRYVVHEGQVIEFDPAKLPDINHYGTDWVVVDAANVDQALAQAELYDARQHPAQTEMDLFAAVLAGIATNDEDEARRWAGWTR